MAQIKDGNVDKIEIPNLDQVVNLVCKIVIKFWKF